MPFNGESHKHLGTVLEKAELSKEGDWRLTQTDILLYETGGMHYSNSLLNAFASCGVAGGGNPKLTYKLCSVVEEFLLKSLLGLFKTLSFLGCLGDSII